MNTEVIEWKDAKTNPPDADTTVLIECPRDDEPVWLGYFDGEDWYTIDGAMPTDVTRWADLPRGAGK